MIIKEYVFLVDIGRYIGYIYMMDFKLIKWGIKY